MRTDRRERSGGWRDVGHHEFVAGDRPRLEDGQAVRPFEQSRDVARRSPVAGTRVKVHARSPQQVGATMSVKCWRMRHWLRRLRRPEQ